MYEFLLDKKIANPSYFCIIENVNGINFHQQNNNYWLPYLWSLYSMEQKLWARRNKILTVDSTCDSMYMYYEVLWRALIILDVKG